MTAGQVFEAFLTLRTITDERRPLPMRAAYLLGRMKKKLEPEYQPIADHRDQIIVAYDNHIDPDDGQEKPGFFVPADKMLEFRSKHWPEIAEAEIEVDVEPMPLSFFDAGPDKPGLLFAAEIAALGDLIQGD